MNLLVVDDDQDLAAGLAEAFEVSGHTVVVRYSGEEGVAAYAETPIDVAFLDVMLPGIDGVEAALQIRGQYPEASVVLMTGFSLQVILDRAHSNGLQCILTKPFDMDRVLARLSELEAG